MKSSIQSYSKEILIIDGDDYRARNHRAFLSTHGYRAVIANTINDALELLEENFYPIVLVDTKLAKIIKEIKSPSTCLIIGKSKEDLNINTIKHIDTPVKIEQFIRTIHLNFLTFLMSLQDESTAKKIETETETILKTSNIIDNRSIDIEINLKLTKYISKLKKLL